MADMSSIKDREAAALALAIFAQDATALRAALARGAQPREAGPRGITLLMRACHGGSDACTAILAPLSDVDARDMNGWTALMFAAAEIRPGCVALLAPLADVNLTNGKGPSGGRNALARAAFAGCERSVAILAPLTQDRGQALLEAAESGGPECIRALLDARGACFTEVFLTQALFLALAAGRADCVEALAPLADLRARQPNTGLTPLLWAASHADYQSVQSVKHLSARSDPGDRCPSSAATALILATEHENAEAAAILLPRSDPLATGFDGRTALEVARGRGGDELIALIEPWHARALDRHAISRSAASPANAPPSPKPRL